MRAHVCECVLSENREAGIRARLYARNYCVSLVWSQCTADHHTEIHKHTIKKSPFIATDYIYRGLQ